MITSQNYDYWLGGHDNFAADRAAALAVSEAAPEAQLMAVENRKFLRRGREEILRFFAGWLELVEPGLVQVSRWRPDEPEPADAEKVWFLGAVGRRPSTAGV